MKKKLKPSFYNDFSCIADKCESNCCSENWNIFIDKKTYKEYMNFSGKLKNELKKNIKIYKDHKSTTDYAKIRLSKDGRCSLLNKDGLCKIHAKIGGESLSHVCRTYPREVLKIGNIYEYKLTISCPEVARYALLNKEKFSFVLEEGEISKKEEYYIPSINFDDYYFDLLWKVRSFSIEIIQNRNIDLWKRIMILGLFCDEIDKNLQSKDVIINIISKYRIMMNTEKVLESIENIQSNNEKKLNLTMQFVKNRVNYGVYNKEFIKICNNIDEVLGISENKPEEYVREKYEELERILYKSFIEKNQYIMENYLVNSIFKEFVFVYKNNSFYDRFVKVVTQYSIVRFLLLGQLGKKKDEFNDDDIIKVFYSFSRVIEHNPQFMNMLIEGLKQKGYDELNYMSILIRE